MRNDQRKYLKERLNEAYRLYRHRMPSPWSSRSAESEPSRVKKAREIIQAYEKKLSDEYDALEKIIQREFRQAQEALLFNDEQKALKAIQDFEDKAQKLKPKK